jgi:hypothetical protein
MPRVPVKEMQCSGSLAEYNLAATSPGGRTLAIVVDFYFDDLAIW